MDVTLLTSITDQTAPPVSNGAPPTDNAGDDFLTRERAALGDDAAFFASSNDNAATVQDGDDDLLGGGGAYNGAHQDGEEITEFKSSYPAVDTQNNVSRLDDMNESAKREELTWYRAEYGPRRNNHRFGGSVPTTDIVVWRLWSSGRGIRTSAAMARTS